MIEALWIAGYLIGYAATVRAQILTHAKKYPRAQWEGDDTAAALYFGACWPIIGWFIAWDLYRAFHPKKAQRKGIFARQFERDRARFVRNPSHDDH